MPRTTVIGEIVQTAQMGEVLRFPPNRHLEAVIANNSCGPSGKTPIGFGGSAGLAKHTLLLLGDVHAQSPCEDKKKGRRTHAPSKPAANLFTVFRVTKAPLFPKRVERLQPVPAIWSSRWTRRSAIADDEAIVVKRLRRHASQFPTRNPAHAQTGSGFKVYAILNTDHGRTI